jgi:hypothetical protein
MVQGIKFTGSVSNCVLNIPSVELKGKGADKERKTIKIYKI